MEEKMKVQNSVSFQIGVNSKKERNSSVNKEVSKSANTIYAGNLNNVMDPIVQKRKDAQKKAMKVVGDAFANEQKIDDEMKERREHIKRLQETVGAANNALKDIEVQRDELRKSYNIDADSQEQSDLQLYQKREEAIKSGKTVSFSDEEMERLKALDTEGLSEYQKRSMDMYRSGETYRTELKDAYKQIIAENAMIRGTKIERMKSDPIGDAQDEASDILKAASDEVYGMLVNEAKEHMDEELQEKVDKAKENAEEQEEEQEKLEAIKEDKEQAEAMADSSKEQDSQQRTEASTGDETTKEIIDTGAIGLDVQKKVKNILDEMKLTEEDLKGVTVDEVL